MDYNKNTFMLVQKHLRDAVRLMDSIAFQGQGESNAQTAQEPILYGPPYNRPKEERDCREYVKLGLPALNKEQLLGLYMDGKLYIKTPNSDKGVDK